MSFVSPCPHDEGTPIILILLLWLEIFNVGRSQTADSFNCFVTIIFQDIFIFNTKVHGHNTDFEMHYISRLIVTMVI